MRKPSTRRILLYLSLPLIFVALWYVVSRIASPWTAVRIEAVDMAARTTEFDYPLRIATYNIAHGRGGVRRTSNWNGGTLTQRRERLETIGSLLLEHDVHIAVLNEVDFAAVWSGHEDQAAIIARAGEFSFIARQRNVDVAIPFVRMTFGNAVLSKYPITGAELTRLPPYSRLEAWLAGNHDAMLTQIRLPDGRNIAVWAVHLEVRSESIRVKAVDRVLDTARDITVPLFMAGDFNSAPRSFPRGQQIPEGPTAVHQVVDSDAFVAAPPTSPPPVGFTFPSANPDRVIDWVFAPVDWHIDDWHVPHVPYSDHLPVIVSVSPPSE
jgi:endonuclease/exonuclease/phosphatase family metal-dependent hydrolase